MPCTQVSQVPWSLVIGNGFLPGTGPLSNVSFPCKTVTCFQSFYCLQFLKNKPKIILRSTRHIWGWHILVPFRGLPGSQALWAQDGQGPRGEGDRQRKGLRGSRSRLGGRGGGSPAIQALPQDAPLPPARANRQAVSVPEVACLDGA